MSTELEMLQTQSEMYGQQLEILKKIHALDEQTASSLAEHGTLMTQMDAMLLKQQTILNNVEKWNDEKKGLYEMLKIDPSVKPVTGRKEAEEESYTYETMSEASWVESSEAEASEVDGETIPKVKKHLTDEQILDLEILGIKEINCEHHNSNKFMEWEDLEAFKKGRHEHLPINRNRRLNEKMFYFSDETHITFQKRKEMAAMIRMSKARSHLFVTHKCINGISLYDLMQDFV